MSYKFQLYPDPLDSICTLSPDGGGTFVGYPNTDINGRKGQLIELPASTPSGHGSELVLEHEGYERMRVRGFLVHNGVDARLQVDDYQLTPVPVAPPQPGPTPPDPGDGPDPNANPLDIINWVYNSTNPNLSTHAGCGTFTEDCCEALHNSMHPAWGHIKKNPGQNQFNGHAVDAIMLIVPSGATAPGIYDIIQDSVSPNARPVFNYVGPVDPDLWYYPPAAIITRNA